MITKMKKIYILMILATALCACEKRELDIPQLEITLPKTTYAVNEPVIFTLDGDADLINFYAGTPGSEFRYRERLTATGTPVISFTTARSVAFPTGADYTFKVLASSDFNGYLTTENIQNATWTDLTSRGTLSRVTTDVQFGTIDLSDIVKPGKPFYIAFKALYTKSAIIQPTWTVKNVSVDVQTEAGPPVKKANVRNMANLTWAAWSVLNPDRVWATPTTAQLQMPGAVANADDNEDWLISQSLDFTTVNRDMGVAVKTSPKLKLNSYTYTGYTTPGTYTVTFEIMNVNRFGDKSFTKEFVITVQ
jgi:hypothetical protein